jgi:hypothetical protein
VLEDEAVRRAYEGVEKPVCQMGKEVGVIREYSDTMLIFLLKGLRPAKYRERYDVVVEAGDRLVRAIARGKERAAVLTLSLVLALVSLEICVEYGSQTMRVQTINAWFQKRRQAAIQSETPR